MERFGAIKNYKSASKIQSLCRLCGMDNAGKVLICENDYDLVVNLDDDDPSLQRKIEICTGIIVEPHDNLPQYCCGICTDKICDFYEFRLMCTSTDIQTRRLLGLPPRQMLDLKPQIKNEAPPSSGVLSSVGQRGRSFVQPKIKIEDQPMLMEIAPPQDVVEAERRQAKRRREPFSNRAEILPMVQLKKLKVEKSEIVCTICKTEFKTQSDLFGHMYVTHVPTFSKYGCSSCGFALEQQQDWKQHISWHSKNKKLYICPRCEANFDKSVQYSKHFQLNKCRKPRPITQPDIHCELCRKKFATRNLYEWHNCFIKNKMNCRKCGQYFAKKLKLFDHFLKCPLPFIELPPPVPKQTQAQEKSKTKLTIKKSSETLTRSESELDIASLLETDIVETAEQPGGLEKINSLLNSVTDAIAKISSAKSKKKKKREKDMERMTESESGDKEKLRHQPIRIRIKTESGTNETIVENANTCGAENAEETTEDHMDDIAYIPQEEHFAEVDSDTDNDNESSQPSTTGTSRATTPNIRIKKEKLDAGYGDTIEQEESNNREIQENSDTETACEDIIRNIKKEPGTEEDSTEVSFRLPKKLSSDKSKVGKVKKAINPLAVKKTNKNKIQRHALILKIKKERMEKENNIDKQQEPPTTHEEEEEAAPEEANSEQEQQTGEENEINQEAEAATAVPHVNHTAMKTKAINPLAAVMKKKSKSKLLKVPRKLALKIKKEKAEKLNREKLPVMRIKQEKPDSGDENPNQKQADVDYLGINPLSLFREKQAKKAQMKKSIVSKEKHSKNNEEEHSSSEANNKTIDNEADNEEMSRSSDKTGDDLEKTTETDTDTADKADNESGSPTTEPVIPNIFETKGKTGFVMLKGTIDGPGLKFPSLPFVAPQTKNQEEQEAQQLSSEDVQKPTKPDSDTIEPTPSSAVPSVPKISTFFKISGNNLGDFQLKFPGIGNDKMSAIEKPETIAPTTVSEEQNTPIDSTTKDTSTKESSISILESATQPTPPPPLPVISAVTNITSSSQKPFIIPGLGSGFTKLTALSFPTAKTPQSINEQGCSTANPTVSSLNLVNNKDEKNSSKSDPLVKPIQNADNLLNFENKPDNNMTLENIKMDPDLDIDGFVPPPASDTATDLDLDDLINEKLNSLHHNVTTTTSEKNDNTEDLLREIDEQLEGKT